MFPCGQALEQLYPKKCNELPAGPNPAAKVKVIEVDQADPVSAIKKFWYSGIPMPNAELM